MKQQTQTNKIEWREVEFDNSEYFEVKKGESITKNKITDGTVPVIAGGQQPAYYHNKSNRPGETITISGSGAYAGFVNYFKEPIFASDCSTVQIKNSLVSSKYTYLFLKSYQNKIYSMQKGIAQPHVYPKDIIKIKIPLPFSPDGTPNLQEQERIVSILEKAEKQKERGKKAEELLDEYLKSVFNEMFYNKKIEKVKLENVCETNSGGTPSRTKKGYWENGTIPWIKSGDLNKNRITEVNEFITESGLKNSSTKYVEPETVLIAMYGATAGKTSITKIKATTNQAVCALVPDKNKLNKIFLLYWLRSSYDYIVSLAFGGGQPNISQQVIRSLKIPIPPLPLQEKFASIVEQVEKMKEEIKKINANSKELFNSLTNKSFKGEL